MQLKDLFPLLKDTFTAFGETKCPRLAAALSYYTIFSIAPILIVILSLAALFLDPTTVRQGIIDQIGTNVNLTAADAVADILSSANKAGKGGNIVATIIGFVTILVGATGLFAALQDSLNTIWGVMPKPDAGILMMFKARVLSFVMVLGIGFLLIVSLAASIAVKAAADWLGALMGGAEWIAPVLNVVLFFVLITGFFALLFKILPDAQIQWRDVWVGAALTSVLFSIGKAVLSWYLAREGTASAYGSAGALVVLLLWINYASQILFFGAEFTKVYANRFGSHIEPEEHAQEIMPEQRAAQGIKPYSEFGGAKGKAKAKNGAPADAKGKAAASALRDKNGKPIEGDPLPSDQNLTPEEKTAKIAELRAEAKKNFEFSMAVLAGGLAAVVFALKKRENDNHRELRRLNERNSPPSSQSGAQRDAQRDAQREDAARRQQPRSRRR